jgi:hypothetical protein
VLVMVPPSPPPVFWVKLFKAWWLTSYLALRG